MCFSFSMLSALYHHYSNPRRTFPPPRMGSFRFFRNRQVRKPGFPAERPQERLTDGKKYAMILKPRRHGEIGRHKGLKIPRSDAYRFESGCRHQESRYPNRVSAFLVSRRTRIDQNGTVRWTVGTVRSEQKIRRLYAAGAESAPVWQQGKTITAEYLRKSIIIC